jgi:hypothetical protein
VSLAPGKGLCLESLSHCRYLEALPILYGENLMVIDTRHCLLYVDRVLLPQHLHAIRHLHFHQYVSDVPFPGSHLMDEWRNMWNILASLEGLVELRVELSTMESRRKSWRDHEARLLNDAMVVTRPRTFEIHLWWFEGDVVPQIPCKIFWTSQLTGTMSSVVKLPKYKKLPLVPHRPWHVWSF